jgi:hypothetical protein
MKKTVLTLAVLTVSGCATIFEGPSKAVTIDSAPGGAEFTIADRSGQVIHRGTTPQQLTLKNGAGMFVPAKYTITMTKAGYEETVAELTPNVAGWYFGNILLGGAIGMLLVDPATGAMYKLPDQTVVPLRKPETAAALDPAPTTAVTAATDPAGLPGTATTH